MRAPLSQLFRSASFSTVARPLPTVLEDFCKKTVGMDLVKSPKASEVSQEALKLLGNSAKSCGASRSFIGSIVDFDGVMRVTSNLRSVEEVTNGSVIIGNMLGQEAAKHPDIEPLTMVLNSERREIFNPHTDFSTVGKTKASMVVMAGVISKGLVRTYTIAADDILKDNPDLYYLSLPIYSSERVKGARPIIYSDKDGKTNISFDFGFEVNQEAALKYSADAKKAQAAISRLIEKTNRLYCAGKIQPFYLQAGDMLFVDNERNLHGRDEVLPDDSEINPDLFGNSSVDCSRVIAVMGFTSKDPAARFKSKDFATLTKGLSKEGSLC